MSSSSDDRFSDLQESLFIVSHLLTSSFFYGIFVILYALSSMLLHTRQRQYKQELEAQRVGGWGAGRGGIGGDGEGGARGQLRTMVFWLWMGRAMFIVISLHWVLDKVLYVINASLAVSNWRVKVYLSWVDKILMLIELALGDLVIIHRLWIVRKNIYLILYPIIGVCGYLVCAVIVTWQVLAEYTARTPASNFVGSPYWPLGLVIATTSVNVYCTIAICGIIWKLSFARGLGGSQLKHVMIILIESAAIYTLWMIPTVIMLAFQYGLWSYFLAQATELYGVVTMLISLRVGLGWAFNSNQETIGVKSGNWNLRFAQDDGESGPRAEQE